MSAFERREQVAREAIGHFTLDVFDRATRDMDFEARDRLRDRDFDLIYEPDLLLARIDPIVNNPRARCIGWACTSCCHERFSPEAARRARKGVDWACSKCASTQLARVYEGKISRSDVLRQLFPWSGTRRSEARS